MLRRIERLEQAANALPSGVESRGLLIPEALPPDDWARFAAAFQRQRDGAEKDFQSLFRDAQAETGIQLSWRMLTSHGWKPCNKQGELLTTS